MIISNREHDKNNKRGINKKTGNNFRNKLDGIFQNSLVVNNF